MSEHAPDGRVELAVPRTTEQTGGPNVSRAVARRRRLPAATWGMVMLIAGEGTLFGAFIASYFFLWSQSREWPPGGIAPPDVTVPVILVAVLALTSAPMQLASRAGRAGRGAAAAGLVLAAFAVQCVYFALSASSFLDDLDAFQPTTNAYGSIYYVLLGADLGHVALGLLLSLWIAAKLAGELTTYRVNALQAIAWYWHAVNALTVVVVATILSAAA